MSRTASSTDDLGIPSWMWIVMLAFFALYLGHAVGTNDRLDAESSPTVTGPTP